jgi:hypothetical protein
VTPNDPRPEPLEGIYNELCRRWAMDAINRDLTLELMFLAWWHWAEPEFLTGLPYTPEAMPLWRMLFEEFGGECSDDPEFLFAAGVMLEITPWALRGDADANEKLGTRMLARSLEVRPQGFAPGYFDESREYGEYFAHHSRLVNVR